MLPSCVPSSGAPEREVAAYLNSHGGLFTDEIEREIMQRLQGRRGTL
jgi:hypothetical protein